MSRKYILQLTLILSLFILAFSACAHTPPTTPDVTETVSPTDGSTYAPAERVTADPAAAPFTGEEDVFEDPTSGETATAVPGITTDASTSQPTSSPTAADTTDADATPEVPEDVFDVPTSTPTSVVPVTMPPAGVTPTPRPTATPAPTMAPFPVETEIQLPRIPI